MVIFSLKKSLKISTVVFTLIFVTCFQILWNVVTDNNLYQIIFSNNCEVFCVVQRVNFEQWFKFTQCWNMLNIFRDIMQIFYSNRNFNLFKWNIMVNEQSFVCESWGMVKKNFFPPLRIHSANTWSTEHPLCARPFFWEHTCDEVQWYGWTCACHMGSESKVFPGGGAASIADGVVGSSRATKEVQVEERGAPGRVKDVWVLHCFILSTPFLTLCRHVLPYMLGAAVVWTDVQLALEATGHSLRGSLQPCGGTSCCG